MLAAGAAGDGLQDIVHGQSGTAEPSAGGVQRCLRLV